MEYYEISSPLPTSERNELSAYDCDSPPQYQREYANRQRWTEDDERFISQFLHPVHAAASRDDGGEQFDCDGTQSLLNGLLAEDSGSQGLDCIVGSDPATLFALSDFEEDIPDNNSSEASVPDLKEVLQRAKATVEVKVLRQSCSRNPIVRVMTMKSDSSQKLTASEMSAITASVVHHGMDKLLELPRSSQVVWDDLGVHQAFCQPEQDEYAGSLISTHQLRATVNRPQDSESINNGVNSWQSCGMAMDVGCAINGSAPLPGIAAPIDGLLLPEGQNIMDLHDHATHTSHDAVRDMLPRTRSHNVAGCHFDMFDGIAHEVHPSAHQLQLTARQHQHTQAYLSRTQSAPAGLSASSQHHHHNQMPPHGYHMVPHQFDHHAPHFHSWLSAPLEQQPSTGAHSLDLRDVDPFMPPPDMHRQERVDGDSPRARPEDYNHLYENATTAAPSVMMCPVHSNQDTRHADNDTTASQDEDGLFAFTWSSGLQQEEENGAAVSAAVTTSSQPFEPMQLPQDTMPQPLIADQSNSAASSQHVSGVSRKCGAGQGRPTRKRRGKNDVAHITVSFLEKGGYFDKPIQVAAAELDVGVTTLKKICRQNNLNRWPFRKRSSLDKLLEKTKHFVRPLTDAKGNDASTATLETQKSGFKANDSQGMHNGVKKCQPLVKTSDKRVIRSTEQAEGTTDEGTKQCPTFEILCSSGAPDDVIIDTLGEMLECLRDGGVQHDTKTL